MKAALLTLADVMGPDGRLRAPRAEMVAATHLNVRTLTRYLTWAVEAGWLVHERRGGNGRTGVYLAAIGGSTDRSSGPELSHNSRRRNAKVAHNSTPPARALSGDPTPRPVPDGGRPRLTVVRGRR